jgi:hypothetical protein
VWPGIDLGTLPYRYSAHQAKGTVLASNSDNRWEEHDHEALVHSHEYFHVTHNHKDGDGRFEHLSSSHIHEHNRASLRHSHVARQNFEHEHKGEAHVHDHEAPAEPAGRGSARRGAARVVEGSKAT